MTDLYSRMEDFSKYRFALLSGEGDPDITWRALVTSATTFVR